MQKIKIIFSGITNNAKAKSDGCLLKMHSHSNGCKRYMPRVHDETHVSAFSALTENVCFVKKLFEKMNRAVEIIIWLGRALSERKVLSLPSLKLNKTVPADVKTNEMTANM